MIVPTACISDWHIHVCSTRNFDCVYVPNQLSHHNHLARYRLDSGYKFHFVGQQGLIWDFKGGGGQWGLLSD